MKFHSGKFTTDQDDRPKFNRQIGNFGEKPDSAKFLDRVNSFFTNIHLNSVASISFKNSKKVIMRKYSLARKLFGLEKPDSDDSERSVINISSSEDESSDWDTD